MFRIDPRTRDFEVFCEGTSNPWGIAWDKEGSAFASACVIDHLWHLTETGYYHRQGGPYPPFTWKLESIVDHKHQKAAYCGITYFDSDAYPEKYRDKLFMGNIHGNGINVDRLERQRGDLPRRRPSPTSSRPTTPGSCPSSRRPGRTARSTSSTGTTATTATRTPTATRTGSTASRGGSTGSATGTRPGPPGSTWPGRPDDQLIDRLGSPNIYYRETAQRLLRERDDPATRPKLEALILDAEAPRKAPDARPLGPDRHRPARTRASTRGSSSDADPTIRAWAVRAAGNFRKVDPGDPRGGPRAGRRPRRPTSGSRSPSRRGSSRGSTRCPTLVGVIDQGRGRPDPRADRLAEPPPAARRPGRRLRRARGRRRPGEVAPAGGDPAPGRRAAPGRRRRPSPRPPSSLLSKLLAGPLEGAIAEAARRSLEILAERLRGGTIPEAQRAASATLCPAARADPRGRPRTRRSTSTPRSSPPRGTTRRRSGPSARSSASTETTRDRRLQALDALIGAGDASVLDVVGPASGRSTGAARPGSGARCSAALGRLDSPRVADVVLGAYPRLEPDLRPRAVELLDPARRLDPRPARRRRPQGDPDLGPERQPGPQARREQGPRRWPIGSRSIWGTVREARNPAREQVIDRMRAILDDAHGDPVAGAEGLPERLRPVPQDLRRGAGGRPRDHPQRPGARTSNSSPTSSTPASSSAPPTRRPPWRPPTAASSPAWSSRTAPQRVVLKLQGGKLETIPKSAVEESKLSPLSLMPEGLEAAGHARGAGRPVRLHHPRQAPRRPRRPGSRSPGRPTGIPGR